jgi:hypothetical protein
VGPEPARVAGLPVGQQRQAPVGEAVPIQLEELVTAAVLGKHEGIAVGGVVLPRAGPVGEESQLRPVAAGHLDDVDLVRVPEPGQDEHLPPGRVPAGERGGAGLGVPQGLLGERGRDVGHTLHDQVVPRLDDRRTRLRGRREQAQTDDCGKNHDEPPPSKDES